MGSNINNSATDSLCGVETKGMVLTYLPWIKNLFGVNYTFIYGTGYSNIDKFTAQSQKHLIGIHLLNPLTWVACYLNYE